MKITDVIAAACEDLGASYEANSFWFEVLIYQAIKSHKTSKKYKQTHIRLLSSDSKITLPTGWFRLDYIYLCGTQEKLCPDIDYTVQENCVILKSDVADGTRYDVWIWTLNEDKEGDLIIPDDWERMLVAYIGWKYTRRYAKDYPAHIMQNYQREYQTQKLANT